MEEIEFFDELPGVTRESKYSELLKLVAKNPGKWGKIGVWEKGKSPSSVGSDIKKGKIKGQPKGVWEATTRSDDEGNISLYVRFTDEVQEPDVASH